MPKITYIDHAGSARIVDGVVGDTLMETAISNNLPGIDADCGGACACATCHVYISNEWAARIGQAEELEKEMLSVAEEVRETSRLSCQVSITDDMDGLVVLTPKSQY